MKVNKIILASAILLAVGACSSRNYDSDAGQKCNRALIAAQEFKGWRIGDVQAAKNASPVISSVPIIYGQSAIANKTAKHGTLVFEVNRSLDTPQSELMGERITNMYCY